MEPEQETSTQELHAKWERSFAAAQQRWEEQLRSSIAQVTEDMRMEMYVSWTTLVEEALQTLLKETSSGLSKDASCSASGIPDSRRSGSMNHPEEEHPQPPNQQQPPQQQQQQQQQRQQRLYAPRSFEECLLATRRQSRQLSLFFLDVLEHKPYPHWKPPCRERLRHREPCVADQCAEGSQAPEGPQSTLAGSAAPPTEECLTNIKSKLQELRKNLTDRSPNQSPGRASSSGRRVPPLPGTAKEISAAVVIYPNPLPRSVKASPERKNCGPPLCPGTPATATEQTAPLQSPKPTRRMEVSSLPQSPVPGTRSPLPLVKAMSATDLQHVAWASRRSSQSAVQSWVPPLPITAELVPHSSSCVALDGAEKKAVAQSPIPSPDASVKTRPSTPGGSAHVMSAQPPNQVSSISGPRQLQEKSQRSTVCQSLQKTHLWRTQPNQTSQVSQVSPAHMQSVIRTPVMVPVASRPMSLDNS